jgi:hypothetical protein
MPREIIVTHDTLYSDEEHPGDYVSSEAEEIVELNHLGSSPRPPSPPEEGPELITISDDRSAGSNLEARNLAALKDRATPKEHLDDDLLPTWGASSKLKKSKKKKGTDLGFPHLEFEPSLRHAQMHQRFGQLRLNEEMALDPSALSEPHDEAGFMAKSDWAASVHVDTSDRLRSDIETLQQKITDMQKDLRDLERQKETDPKKRYQVLYRLDDICYLDHPEWTQGQTSIMSRIPLNNFDLFLERNKSILFIVYRDFGNGLAKPETGNFLSPPKHVSESIGLVDKRLCKVFERLLKRDWRYERDFQRLRQTGEIDAPYLFIYHHRRYWKDMISNCSATVRKHLSLLTAYVSKNYGHEYIAADTSFKRRRVSLDFVKYLFQPGDILVSQTAGQYIGLVASSWLGEAILIPTEKSGDKAEYLHEKDFSELFRLVPPGWDHDGSEQEDENDRLVPSPPLNLSFRRPGPNTKDHDRLSPTRMMTQEFRIQVWKWSFDGEFKREADNIAFRLSPKTSDFSNGPTEWEMHGLDIYPLRYAPKSVIKRLHRRGKIFWDCRKRCLVSYHQTVTEAQDEVSAF